MNSNNAPQVVTEADITKPFYRDIDVERSMIKVTLPVNVRFLLGFPASELLRKLGVQTLAQHLEARIEGMASELWDPNSGTIEIDSRDLSTDAEDLDEDVATAVNSYIDFLVQLGLWRWVSIVGRRWDPYRKAPAAPEPLQYEGD